MGLFYIIFECFYGHIGFCLFFKSIYDLSHQKQKVGYLKTYFLPQMKLFLFIIIQKILLPQ